MKKQSSWKTVVQGIAVVGAVWAPPVLAQDGAIPQAEASDGGLADIVVTAQRQAENLQDVPVTIQAFDQAALETKRIVGFEQIANFTPALNVSPSPSDANGLRFTLRGIGVADPQIGVEGKVALYVDGQYFGRSVGLAFDSPDLERIEVLKGPQGALYGRNAVAGAINLISAKPQGGDFFGRVFADYGNYNAVRVGGAVNIPAGEDGGIRISTLYNRRDGWVKNRGVGDDFSGYERIGGRFAIGGDVTPNLRLDAAVDVSNAKNQGAFYAPLAGTNGPTALFAAAVTPVSGRVKETASAVDNETGNSTSMGAVFSADWEYADNHSLKLLTGWRHSDAKRFTNLLSTYNPTIGNIIYNSDLDRNPANGQFSIRDAFLAVPQLLGAAGIATRPDYLPGVAAFAPNSAFAAAPGGAFTLEDQNQYTIDLSATGSFGDRVDYTAGLFYLHEIASTGPQAVRTGDLSNLVSMLPALGNIATGLGLAGALQNPTLPPPVRAALLGQLQTQIGNVASFYDAVRMTAQNKLDLKTNSYAAYGQVTWHLGDKLRLITGARYSIDRKHGQQQNYSPFFNDTTNLLGAPILPNIATKTFRSFDPTLIVQYDLAPKTMVYASRVESFRSGGFNQIALGKRLPGKTHSGDFIFGNEEITSYEVGIKSDLFDRKVRFNASGFYYLLDNEQLSLVSNPLDPTSRVIVNSNTKIWGLEADLTVALAQGVSANIGYAWTDGDADSVVNPVSNVVTERPELIGAPKHSLSANIDFDRDLNDRVGIFGHAGYNYKSRTIIVFLPLAKTTDQNMVDAQLGVRFGLGSSTAKLSIWGQNLLDDKAIVDRTGLGAIAYDIAQYATPRTYGVTLGIDF